MKTRHHNHLALLLTRVAIFPSEQQVAWPDVLSGSVRTKCSLGRIGLGFVQKDMCQYCRPRILELHLLCAHGRVALCCIA